MPPYLKNQQKTLKYVEDHSDFALEHQNNGFLKL